MSLLSVVKGHGTENDFVLVPDLDDVWGELLTADVVAALCDRRAGLGADGVIRIVPTSTVPEWSHDADAAPWFMDYRNADGSIAEMCGNGARVFARYLLTHGLVEGPSFTIATRGGPRQIDVVDDALAVHLGVATFPSSESTPEVLLDGHRWNAVSVAMPNPHAVTFVDDLGDAGPLLDAPGVLPHSAFPHGVNVEFVVDRGPAHVAMRVFERGSGETRSCGTGAAAVAVAARRRAAGDAPLDTVPATWIVDVPGGRLTVTELDDGQVILAGPAQLVGTAEVDLAALVS